MKSKTTHRRILLGLLFAAVAGVCSAEGITGTVRDGLGRPLAGVRVESGTHGAVTGHDGKYSIETVDTSQPLRFSKAGYTSGVALPDGKTVTDITLEKDAHRLDETVHLGYTDQTRNSISGAVVTVDGSTLERHPTLNLLQTLPGNLTGLNYFESDHNLFNSSVGLVSRGISTLSGRNMLIVIDGIVSTTSDYRYISPQEIETVSLLKDASSSAIYGIQGANGVLVITTKRGHIGKPVVNVKYNTSLQRMTNRPLAVSSAEYAEMRNQAAYNDNPSVGEYSQFSAEDVEGFRNGGDYYPDNNWVDHYLRPVATLQRVGVDVAGGSEKIRYYSMLGYSYQSSQFYVDRNQEKYNSNPALHLIKARTNLDMNFHRYLTGFATISANIVSNRMPGYGDSENSSQIYERLLYMPPTTYGPTTLPDGQGEVVATEKETDPVYGILNRSGYNIRTSTNFAAQAGLKLDLGFWVKGLSISGSMAFQGIAAQLQKNSITYQRQIRDLSGGYGSLAFENYGTQVNGVLKNSNSGNFAYDLNYYAFIDYSRQFGRHSVMAKGYSYYLKQVLSNSSSGVEIMPYIRHTMGAELQYGFADRYFIKGDFAYSGSDQFARVNRYAALPSIAAAWVVSNERFMEGVPQITNLKLRASYGITANDQFPGGGRFLYLDFISNWGAETLIGNPNLYAERIRNQNYGIDIGLWNSLGISFDYFVAQNNKMLISSNNDYPSYMGINNTTIVNKGRMRNSGFELNIDYTRDFNSDWSATIGAGLSYARNKVLYTNELKNADFYRPARTEGYAAGSIFGYRVDYSNGNGFINTQAELERYTPLYTAGGLGTPRLGDLIYKDLNEDGRIGVEDMDYLGCTIPEFFYSLRASVSYRSLSLFIQLDGAGKGSEMMVLPPNRMDGIFTDIHLNAWTAQRYASGEEITYPALYIGSSSSNNSSDFFLNNTSYVTLRNITLSYNLPEKAAAKIGAAAVGIQLSAENLVTFGGMKSRYYDPRVISSAAFQPYRIFNLGINLTF